jgi:site-specific recombinase XerD
VKNLLLFVATTSGSLQGLEHGVATEVYNQHHDLEQVRALLGHTRIETTQVYAQIQPAQLKQSVSFYEAMALEAFTT